MTVDRDPFTIAEQPRLQASDTAAHTPAPVRETSPDPAAHAVRMPPRARTEHTKTASPQPVAHHPSSPIRTRPRLARTTTE